MMTSNLDLVSMSVGPVLTLLKVRLEWYRVG